MDDPDIIHKHLEKFKSAPHAPIYDQVVVRLLVTSMVEDATERRYEYSVPADKYDAFITEITTFFEHHELPQTPKELA